MIQDDTQSSTLHICIPGRKLEDGKKFTLFDVQFIEFFQTQAVTITTIKIQKNSIPKKFPPAATLLSTLVPIPSSWQTLIYFIFLTYYLF